MRLQDKSLPSANQRTFEEWWISASFDTMDPKTMAQRGWDAALKNTAAQVPPNAGIHSGEDLEPASAVSSTQPITDGEIRALAAVLHLNCITESGGMDYTKAVPKIRQWLRLYSVPSATQPTSRDWTEDAAHENGEYSCTCSTCGNLFIGHKRRVTCKVCHVERTAKP